MHASHAARAHIVRYRGHTCYVFNCFEVGGAGMCHHVMTLLPMLYREALYHAQDIRFKAWHAWISITIQVGDYVNKGDALAEVLTDKHDHSQVIDRIRSAFELSKDPVMGQPIISSIIFAENNSITTLSWSEFLRREGLVWWVNSCLSYSFEPSLS